MHFGVVAGSTPVAHYPSLVICGGGSGADISQRNAGGNIKSLRATLARELSYIQHGVGFYLCQVNDL